MKPVRLPLAFALSLLFAGAVQAAETLRYVVLVDGGKKAGEQVVETDDDGRTKVRFIFKDNGRGPELDEEFTLGPDGTYTDYKVTGTTTFGAPMTASTCPPTMAVTAGAIPANGRCVIGSESLSATASMARNGALPTPGEP